MDQELLNLNCNVAEIMDRIPVSACVGESSSSASDHKKKRKKVKKEKLNKSKRDKLPVNLPERNVHNFAVPKSHARPRKVKSYLRKDEIIEALHPPSYMDEASTTDDFQSTGTDTFSETDTHTFSETDPGSVDVDYPDELYHLPSKIQHKKQRRKKRGKVNVKRAGAKVIEAAVKEELVGLLTVDNTQLFEPTYDDSFPCNISGGGRIPGFKEYRRQLRDFEDTIFRFPAGEGVSPEEIEEIPDELNYWLNFEKKRSNSDFTEEDIKNEVMEKIEDIQDYFRRLERGQLTEEELRDIRPRNFHGPYYPTPKQLRVSGASEVLTPSFIVKEVFYHHFLCDVSWLPHNLETLDIKVTWPLSTLHSFSKECTGLTNDEMLRKHGVPYDASHSSWEESQIILRNWIKFQKEYKFYDLRPMISVRTARILGFDGNYRFEPFHYVDKTNYKHFLLYLAQDLPKRSLGHMAMRIKNIITCIEDNQLVKKRREFSCHQLAKLEFLLKEFGNAYFIPELIIGEFNSYQLLSAFQRFLYQKEIKFRTGQWTETEMNRLKLGLKKVCNVNSLEEAGRLKNIGWKKIMPYVRTRKYNSFSRKLAHMLADVANTDVKERKIVSVKVIKLIYNSDIDCFNNIDWYKAARIIGHKNPMLLSALFANHYRKVPHMKRRTFEDAIRYMHRVMLPKMIDPLENPTEYLLETNHQREEHRETLQISESEREEYEADDPQTSENGNT